MYLVWNNTLVTKCFFWWHGWLQRTMILPLDRDLAEGLLFFHRDKFFFFFFLRDKSQKKNFDRCRSSHLFLFYLYLSQLRWQKHQAGCERKLMQFLSRAIKKSVIWTDRVLNLVISCVIQRSWTKGIFVGQVGPFLKQASKRAVK